MSTRIHGREAAAGEKARDATKSAATRALACTHLSVRPSRTTSHSARTNTRRRVSMM